MVRLMIRSFSSVHKWFKYVNIGKTSDHSSVQYSNYGFQWLA